MTLSMENLTFCVPLSSLL